MNRNISNPIPYSMDLIERTMERVFEKKAKLDSLRPLDRGTVNRLKQALIVEMTYNSNSIEGNTLDLNETRLVLEEGLTVGGKTLREHLEVTNHKMAMESLEGLVHKETIEVLDILNIHALIMDRLDPHNADFFRSGRVFITGTSYIPPKPALVPQLVGEFVRKFNHRPGSVVETAAKLHMEFIDIHPFVDGNGRTARLLLNLYLMRNGYPPIIIKKVDRKRYISSIRASQLKLDPVPFFHLITLYVEQALDLWLESVSEGPGDHISLKEASRGSRYSQEYLSLLVRTGRLPGTKFGRNWKVRMEDVERYEKEHI